MKLLFKKKLGISELDSSYSTSLISCSIDNKFGFNECQKGRDYAHKLVVDQYALTSEGLKMVKQENIKRLLNEITKDKYGIIIHNPIHEFLKEIEVVSDYLRKKKLLDVKSRLGHAEYEEIERPVSWGELCPESLLKSKIDYLLDKGDFLSLWPKYWGEWGEHCLVIYNNDVESMISLVKNDSIDIDII